MAILDPLKREQLLAEILDPNRTILYCGKHLYAPGQKSALYTPEPVMGCLDCQKVYWISEAAKFPPHERRERLERLQETVHHFVEAIHRGEWDVEIYDSPVIETESN